MLIPPSPSQGSGLLRPLLAAGVAAAETRLVSEPRSLFLALDGVLADIARAASAAEVSLREYRQLPGLYAGLPSFPDARDALKRAMDMGYDLVAVVMAESENQIDDHDRLRWLQRHHAELAVQRAPAVPAPWGKPADVLVDARGAAALAVGFQGLVVAYDGRWNTVLEALRTAAVATAEAAADQRKRA